MSNPATVTPIKKADKIIEPTSSMLNIFDMTESSFKALLERRAKNRVTFLTIVKSALTENVDYCSLPVKGKKALPTLLKGGGEVVCQILGLTPRIVIAESNDKSLLMCCELLDENQQVVSVGFGARSYALDANSGGLNKTTKMAVKSAYLDAVIRAGALSSLFTMDLEESQESKPVSPEPKPTVLITAAQVKQIEKLIEQHKVDKVRCLNWISKFAQSKNHSAIADLNHLPNTLLDEVLSKIPSLPIRLTNSFRRKTMTTNKIMNACFGSINPSSPDKKFYTQHGILVFGTNDKGEERISLKLSSMPIDADFNGWFSVFPPKDKPATSPANTSNDFDPEF